MTMFTPAPLYRIDNVARTIDNEKISKVRGPYCFRRFKIDTPIPNINFSASQLRYKGTKTLRYQVSLPAACNYIQSRIMGCLLIIGLSTPYISSLLMIQAAHTRYHDRLFNSFNPSKELA